MVKRLYVCLFALLLSISSSIPCFASAYDAHPKLVVILVIDQFREDYLERYRTDFKGNGFDLFLDHGAYFPDCYYDYANLVTAAGHSAISTGAYTDGNGIASNEWWDLNRNTKRPISSVEDPRYSIVGLPATESQILPAKVRLLEICWPPPLAMRYGWPRKASPNSSEFLSRIVPQFLHQVTPPMVRFWIDPQSGAFITSTYYMSALPDWATTFNQGDNAVPGSHCGWGFRRLHHSSPPSVRPTLPSNMSSTSPRR